MGGDRRIDFRKRAAEKAEVQWTDAARQTVTITALIADISRSGARLHVDQPISMPASLKLSLNNTERNCQVRYCVRRMGGFAVGVRFDSH